ncbi:MAG: T9SS type A sorting domain-containing protein [Candidatus Eisenbacteria bacterium]|uniref:T9SS type A sorting domain-containing protein n=1 Tax=Eiseniibacteriota bacterium TaxID=2212470 RepID=A0A956NA17_UNCEI|nr:T9SS type A sorting domain-containing protein [Candidatus Eisenbacteria bacterium]
MKKTLWLVAALAAGYATQSLAAGFGTPTVDGVLDAVYNAPEASDPSDEPQGNAPMDLLDLYVCNDNDFWYFYFTVDDDIVATNWGKYLLYIDTTGDGSGATFDAWGRNVAVINPNGLPEYSLNGWVDGGGVYDENKTQLWHWTGAAWTQEGMAADAALLAGTPSAIEWKVSRAALGDPATIWCEVFSTGGGGGDNAQDTINDPADDWNATDWATQAQLFNSTRVDRASGSDTTPPIVTSATTIGQEPINEVLVQFSEAVTAATAEVPGNYSITGGGAITIAGADLQADPTKVILTLGSGLGYGTAYTVQAVNIKDLAGNTIVNNGTTNVDCFKIFSLTFQARMNLWLRNNSVPPDTVGVEGSSSPLTWDPTCDNLLFDADMDSVFTGTYQFTLGVDCGTGLIPEGSALEYKFTHNCDTWESTSNHFYAFDDMIGEDTLDIWWQDEAPSDFTLNAMDVILSVDTNGLETPPTAADSVGVAGSELPFTWDLPKLNMHDDGVAPDDTADDGVYSGRFTFPAGTHKNLEYKFAINRDYECAGGSNRGLVLDDTTYSTTNPLIMPLAVYDVCLDPASAPDPVAAPSLHLAVSPNPFSSGTAIRFVAPTETNGTVAVFDAAGRQIRVLAHGTFDAGVQQIEFDSKDGAGRQLSPGVYFVRVALENGVATQTMTVVR